MERNKDFSEAYKAVTTNKYWERNFVVAYAVTAL